MMAAQLRCGRVDGKGSFTVGSWQWWWWEGGVASAGGGDVDGDGDGDRHCQSVNNWLNIVWLKRECAK